MTLLAGSEQNLVKRNAVRRTYRTSVDVSKQIIVGHCSVGATSLAYPKPRAAESPPQASTLRLAPSRPKRITGGSRWNNSPYDSSFFSSLGFALLSTAPNNFFDT